MANTPCKSSNKSKSNRSDSSSKYSINHTGAVTDCIFFCLFFLYLQFYIDLRLIYHCAGVITNFPDFFRGWDFFKDFINYPGGLAEYAAAFLAQLFNVNWLGPVIVTLQAWLLCLCTDYLLKAVNARKLHFIRWVPALLILPLYGQYSYHFTETTVLALALLFSCIYIRVAKPVNFQSYRSARRADIAHISTFLILSVVLYTIAGGAYLLFAAICAIYELLYKRNIYGLLYLAAGLVIPYIEGVLLFGAYQSDAFLYLLPMSWKVLFMTTNKQTLIFTYSLYLITPLVILVVCLWQVVSQKSFSNKRNTDTGSKKQSRGKLSRLVAATTSAYKSRTIVKRAIQLPILIGVACAIAFAFVDSEKRIRFKVDYYACHRMWPQVLKAAEKSPYDEYVINAVNRALYHTGRLAYDMCSWPQHPDTLLLTNDKHKMAYWNRFDTRLDLGLLNLAQEDLVEALEIFGLRPIILKRLALINMAKNDIGSAKIYLGALSKTIFDADWANHYLVLLDTDPDLSGDTRIQNLRGIMLHKDDIKIFPAREAALTLLLSENVKNHMAFEYLNAVYLQTKQLGKFVENVKHLNELGYSRIPQLYEEAILIHTSMTKKPIKIEGFSGSRESYVRMEQFGNIVNRYQGNKKAAIKELARDFGDSYLFYFLYEFSGVSRWINIPEK